MASNRFRLNNIDGKISIEKIPIKNNTTKFSGENTRVNNKIVLVSNKFNKIDVNIDGFVKSILTAGITQAFQTKIIVQLKNIVNLVAESFSSCESIKDKSEVHSVANSIKEHINSKLEKYDTTCKMKKELRRNSLFVEPEEKSIGNKWKTVRDAHSDLPDHKIIQSTFQYVSIEKSISSLFSQKEFSDVYFAYNDSKHQCKPNEYEDFCCGSNYKDCEIYSDRNTIQLQLAIDDFEVCEPCKSKQKIHKLCAVYFQIRNMPYEARSKLDNIYLVSLCETSNFKDSEDIGDDFIASFDSICELITNELKILETNGISVGSRVLKVGLVNVAGDNLGANSVFGFARSFSATFFCRMCEIDK